MTSLADLRKNYTRASLSEEDSPSSPFVHFEQWLNEAIAAKIPEPNAMTLATVGSDLRPSARVVLIKAFDERGFVWFTNYQSRKGHELAGNPYAALQFHWVELERVVRIEGIVTKTDAPMSDHYFESRPHLSQLAALASAQSTMVASRQVLVDKMDELAQQHSVRVPRPAHWGGYRLEPDRFEFWQGRPDRLHDRLYYERQKEGWLRSRLAP